VVGVQVETDLEAFPYSALTARQTNGWSVVQDVVGGRQVAVFWESGTVSPLDSPIIADSRDVGSTGVFDRELNGRLLSFHASPQKSSMTRPAAAGTSLAALSPARCRANP